MICGTTKPIPSINPAVTVNPAILNESEMRLNPNNVASVRVKKPLANDDINLPIINTINTVIAYPNMLCPSAKCIICVI